MRSISATASSLFILMCYVFNLSMSYPNETKCKEQVATVPWTPIRIDYEMVDFDLSENEYLSTFMEEALGRAVDYWSSTLKVRRSVSKSLYYERPCFKSIGSYCLEPGTFRLDYESDEWFSYENEILETFEFIEYRKLPYFLVDSADIDGLDLYDCSLDTSSSCVLSRSIPSMPGSGSLEDFDLHLKVIFWEDLGRSVANAGRLGRDECGRPTIGLISVSNEIQRFDIDAAVSVFLHEIAHVLGIDIESMAEWITNDSGERLIKKDKEFVLKFWAKKDQSMPIIHLPSLLLLPKEFKLYSVFVPYHLVDRIIDSRKLVPTGGDNAWSCRCPLKPDDRFTESDLMDCLSTPSNCGFAITSPHVVASAMQYYNCHSREILVGMELELATTRTASYLNPHWKSRNLQNELMNSIYTHSDIVLFVSPMTLALLQDSGWYFINTEFGSTLLVPGIHWGFQDGCALLGPRLIETIHIYDDLADSHVEENFFLALPFTSKELNGKRLNPSDVSTKCSSDAMSYFRIITNQPTSDSETYGTYFERTPCLLVNSDYQMRCVDTYDVNDGNLNPLTKAVCVVVVCNEDLSSYSFEVVTADGGSENVICETDGQEIEKATITYRCVSPSIVCAQLKYSHYPKNSGINAPPGRSGGGQNFFEDSDQSRDGTNDPQDGSDDSSTNSSSSNSGTSASSGTRGNSSSRLYYTESDDDESTSSNSGTSASSETSSSRQYYTESDDDESTN